MLDISVAPALSYPSLLFLTVVVSLSGVLMPGPVFAVTIARGHSNKYAGAFIALGHGVIEFPLMGLIYFGFVQYFTDEAFRKAIALLGGIMLIYLGLQIIRTRKEVREEGRDFSYGSITAGVITTSANPYFFIWWATIGAALIMSASLFGPLGFIVFAVVHWLCDFLWGLAVSLTVFKSKKFWSQRLHETIFSGCGVLLIAFGAWFLLGFI